MRILYKKIICLVLFLFFSLNMGSHLVFAQMGAVTDTVSITAEVVGTITVTPSGGGIGLPKTAVSFSGQAYPGATVNILKKGLPATSVIADNAGYFSATLEEKY